MRTNRHAELFQSCLRSLVALCLLCALPSQARGEDITNLGGTLTHAIPGPNGLQVAAPGVEGERRDKQLVGFETFHGRFKRKTGLGPGFINASCAGCHVENGKSPLRFKNREFIMNRTVFKVGLNGLQDNGAPIPPPGIGPQIQPKTTRSRRQQYRARVRIRKVKGTYADGERYTLTQPVYRIIPRNGPYPRRAFRDGTIRVSHRMSPGLFGLGLLEAIPESAILALSDPDDEDGDGISGKPNFVPDIAADGVALGRFGFKATQPSVAQQSGAAAFFDMGVSNEFFRAEGEETVEIDSDEFERLVLYQTLAGVPEARDQDKPDVIRGKAIFQELSCQSCHTMSFTTEDSENPELNDQKIFPFTDMLLHDMGDDLADTLVEYAAEGREWRTQPLWGLGFFATVSKVAQRYLHDGRAKSVEEAILWHGGEAEASKNRFKELSKTDRKKLIRFLKSL